MTPSGFEWPLKAVCDTVQHIFQFGGFLLHEFRTEPNGSVIRMTRSHCLAVRQREAKIKGRSLLMLTFRPYPALMALDNLCTQVEADAKPRNVLREAGFDPVEAVKYFRKVFWLDPDPLVFDHNRHFLAACLVSDGYRFSAG